MQAGFDYAEIIDEVTQRALGETTTAGDVISARRSIYLTLENWHALSLNTWRIKTRDFVLVQGELRLPEEMDDVLTVMALHDAEADRVVETPLTRLSETEYATLGTKRTRGRPTQFVLRRTDPPTMFVSPIGRENEPDVLRITYVARPDRFDRYGRDADDMPTRWLNALILGSALDLASKFPERAGDRFNILAAAYPVALQTAVQNDKQRKSFHYRIG